jgi:hypothetical protein
VGKVGIYFRGRTIRHVRGWGQDLWIAVRIKDSHELIKVLRDKGFFSKEIEGYLVLPEDALKEVLGEDLYKELLESNEDSGDSGSLMTPAPQRDTRGKRGVRGVSL